ncbi:MAG: VOC family protein [Nocardioides sp.]
MEPFWLSAFLDLEAARFDRAVAFWRAVTGFGLSDARGEHGEFATLVPADGDDYLRVQRLGSGRSRIHLDLHVTDPRAAADRAVGLGATELADRGYVVLRSPGGLVLCFVGHGGAVRPSPAVWPEGHRSMVYQVSIDVPRAAYDVESAFWCQVLGGRPEVLVRRPEFSWVRGPRQLALDVLLQRTDDEAGEVAAHLDLGTTDRAAEVARQVGLGAELLGHEEFWATLRDPAGLRYCITDRDPATGRLTGAVAGS